MDKSTHSHTSFFLKFKKKLYLANMKQCCTVFVTLLGVAVVCVHSFMLPYEDMSKKSAAAGSSYQHHRKRFENPWFEHLLQQSRSQRKAAAAQSHHKRNSVLASLADSLRTKRGKGNFLSVFRSFQRLEWSSGCASSYPSAKHLLTWCGLGSQVCRSWITFRKLKKTRENLFFLSRCAKEKMYE